MLQRVDKPHPCHSEEYPKGTCFAARSDVGIRNLFRQKPAKSAGFVRFRNGLPRQCEHWLAMTGFFDSLKQGRQRRPCFGVSINPRPCHSEPVTDVTGVGIRNLLAGNLRKSAGIMRFGNGLPRQSVPQGHLLRGADWLAMTRCVGADDQSLSLRGRWQREALAEGETSRGFLSPSRLRRQPPHRGGLAARRCRADGTSYPKGICSAALHGRTPSPTSVMRTRLPVFS